MKIKYSKIGDFIFFLYMCSLYTKITYSIPFFILCSLILILRFFRKKGKMFDGLSIWYLLVIIMFSVGITYSAGYPFFKDYIVFDIIRMLESLILILWVQTYSSNFDDIKKYLKLFLFVMIYLSLRLIVSTPISYWGTERLGETIDMKPTMLGLSMAFGANAAYFLRDIYNSKKYLILAIILTIICALTGSRMALITLILGVMSYLILKSKGKKFIRNFFLVIFLAFFSYQCVMNIKPLYNTIGYRFENFLSSNNTEQSVSERNVLRNSAMDLFKKNPIYGAGTEGFRAYARQLQLYRVTYSHSNYTEMLANYGVIGFSIYYVFLFIFFIRILKTKGFHEKNPLAIYAAVILGMILLSDYGYISYYGMFHQFFLSISYFVMKKINLFNNEDGGLSERKE